MAAECDEGDFGVIGMGKVGGIGDEIKDAELQELPLAGVHNINVAFGGSVSFRVLHQGVGTNLHNCSTRLASGSPTTLK